LSFDRRAALAVTLFVVAACAAHTVERRLVTPDQVQTLDGKSAFLKAHLRRGYVYRKAFRPKWTPRIPAFDRRRTRSVLGGAGPLPFSYGH
jgi:hypothetical protein